MAALALAAPAMASVSVDLGVTSPYYSWRELGPLGETDYLYQAYGLAFHGDYIGAASGWQVSLDGYYADRDLGGRDVTLYGGQAALKYPYDRGGDIGETSMYYLSLNYRQDEVTLDGSSVLAAKTALVGFEIYSSSENGTFAAGAGLGRQWASTPFADLAGWAASGWVSFSILVGKSFELAFSTTATWAQPTSTDYTLMLRETRTSIGAGFSF
jgi:hypothetical protein